MFTESHRRSPWSFLAMLFAIAFAINLPWEMAQMLGYVEMAGRSWRETTALCTAATIGDAAITLAIYGVGALAAGHLRWGMQGRWNIYATAGLLGAAAAAAIEWRALAMDEWSYNERMPIALGVGLWPLLQLTLLVPASFWAAARLMKITNPSSDRGRCSSSDSESHPVRARGMSVVQENQHGE